MVIPDTLKESKDVPYVSLKSVVLSSIDIEGIKIVFIFFIKKILSIKNAKQESTLKNVLTLS